MKTDSILEQIKKTESPLKLQLLTAALISEILKARAKRNPVIIGVEDLIIDRMNACKHWKSEIDCEMSELLIRKYAKELDWSYLEKRAQKPENDLTMELAQLKNKTKK